VLSFLHEANPQSGVVYAADGNFYGVTIFGTNSAGDFYRVSPNGDFTKLYAFDYVMAEYPNGVTEGADGAFYGTGYYGGTDTNSLGTVFKITAAGTATLLASFHGTNGSHPQAKLLLATDGNFYGTTTAGGAFDLGTVFRVTPTGVISSLVSFSGTNGASPFCALMQAQDGLIYGTTYGGGIGFTGPYYTGNGTIFSIDTNGTFSTRYQFAGYPDDAARPEFGALVQDTNGFFYGTSESGGSGGSGTIFRMSPDGQEKLLHSFTRPDYDTGTNVDGWEPSAGLVQTADGSFYGVTMSGGSHNRGVIFRLVVTSDPPTLECRPTADGTNLVLKWDTISGASYEVQSTTNLVSGYWSSVTSVLATNTAATASDALRPAESRFYRVKQLP
jgi:uncharacterized repeat protein (TIGR03803 family)